MSSSNLRRKVHFILTQNFNTVEIQDRFAKEQGWIPRDPVDRPGHRFKMILIKDMTQPLQLEGTFKVVFPHCAIMKVRQSFKEKEGFNDLLKHLRGLTWRTSELVMLVSFLDRGDFPIVMIVESIDECSYKTGKVV